MLFRSARIAAQPEQRIDRSKKSFSFHSSSFWTRPRERHLFLDQRHLLAAGINQFQFQSVHASDVAGAIRVLLHRDVHDLKAAAALDAKQLNALAPGAIPLDRGVLVLVGDKGTITSDVAALSSQPDLSEADNAIVRRVQQMITSAVEYTPAGEPKR